MARNNYQYEKRQKDIAKKKKQDEKRLKKLNKHSDSVEEKPDVENDFIDNSEIINKTNDEGID